MASNNSIPGDVVLPLPSTMAGRDKEWKCLLSSYERIASKAKSDAFDCKEEMLVNTACILLEDAKISKNDGGNFQKTSTNDTYTASSLHGKNEEEADANTNNCSKSSSHHHTETSLHLPLGNELCRSTHSSSSHSIKSILNLQEGSKDGTYPTTIPQNGGTNSESHGMKSEVFVLRGGAGTGKSFLIRKLQNHIFPNPMDGDSDRLGSSIFDSLDETPLGYFCQGHCEGISNTNQARPHVAITAAFNALIDDIFHNDDLTTFRSVIQKSVGGDVEMDILYKLIPKLKFVMTTPASSRAVDDGLEKYRRNNKVATDSSIGLHYVFRKFLRALAEFCHKQRDGPVVISIEDVESADVASLALIKSIATDSISRNVLLLLAIREEDIEDESSEDKKSVNGIVRDALKAIREADALKYTDLTLANLDEVSSNKLISRLLRLDEDEDRTKELSRLLYGKTRGNPFFTIQFIRSLIEEKLFVFQIVTMKYTWDASKIQCETSVSENVVHLLSRKIKRLDANVQFVLLVASCLPSKMESTIIIELVLAIEENPITCENEGCKATFKNPKFVWDTLDLAVELGLLERLHTFKNGEIFKFAHERIRQSCNDLLPLLTPVADKFHKEVGTKMYHMAKSKRSQPWMLFLAVDNLNAGIETSDEVVGEDNLSYLNVEAGLAAASLSAFMPALEYFRTAIALIHDPWIMDYDFSIMLHTEYAACLYCTGNFEESQKQSELVFAHARTLREKEPSYLNIIALLKAKGELEQALQIGCEFLAKLDEPFSLKPSKIKIMNEKKITAKRLKDITDEQLMKLPVCTDQNKATTCYVLGMLFGPLVHLQYKDALDVMRMRSIRITVKHGVSDASALACAYYGSYLISKETCDITGGFRFGRLALELSERIQANELKSRTILLSNFMIVHWKIPLAKTLDSLMKGYEIGMSSGDIEMAFTCAGIYQQHYYYCGLSLDSGEQDLKAFCDQMMEYKQTKELRTYQPLRQCLLNLMGRSKHPVIMTGDAMNQAEFETGKVGVAVMKSYQMQLAYYFNDIELAEKLMDELRPQSTNFTAPYFQVARRFFFALILFARAKETKIWQKSFIKTARKDLEWINERLKQGAINCNHKYLILVAEESSFRGDLDQIKQNFDKAISVARRSGFRQDEALSNELAAHFFVQRDDKYWAAYYMNRAKVLYTEWGAHAKADQLQKLYPTFCEVNDENVDQKGKDFMGRRRFSTRLSDAHKSIISTESDPSGVFNRGSISSSISGVNLDDSSMAKKSRDTGTIRSTISRGSFGRSSFLSQVSLNSGDSAPNWNVLQDSATSFNFVDTPRRNSENTLQNSASFSSSKSLKNIFFSKRRTKVQSENDESAKR